MQDRRGADEGVAGEVQFLGEVEDARPPRARGRAVADQEHGLEVSQFPGDGLHLGAGQRIGVGEHREAVAAVGTAGEDVDMVKAHGATLPVRGHRTAGGAPLQWAEGGLKQPLSMYGPFTLTS